jgi:hypothetical protein
MCALNEERRPDLVPRGTVSGARDEPGRSMGVLEVVLDLPFRRSSIIALIRNQDARMTRSRLELLRGWVGDLRFGCLLRSGSFRRCLDAGSQRVKRHTFDGFGARDRRASIFGRTANQRGLLGNHSGATFWRTPRSTELCVLAREMKVRLSRQKVVLVPNDRNGRK